MDRCVKTMIICRYLPCDFF